MRSQDVRRLLQHSSLSFIFGCLACSNHSFADQLAVPLPLTGKQLEAALAVIGIDSVVANAPSKDSDFSKLPPATGPTMQSLVSQWTFGTSDADLQGALLNGAKDFDRLMQLEQLAEYKVQKALIAEALSVGHISSPPFGFSLSPSPESIAAYKAAFSQLQIIEAALDVYDGAFIASANDSKNGYKLTLKDGKTQICNSAGCKDLSNKAPHRKPTDSDGGHHCADSGNICLNTLWDIVEWVVKSSNIDTPSRWFGSNNDIVNFFHRPGTTLASVRDQALDDVGFDNRSDLGQFLRNPVGSVADAWDRGDVGKAVNKALCGFC